MPSPQLKVSPKMKFKMSRMFGRLQFFEGFTHYNAFSDISRYYHPAAMAILLCELCENTQEFYEFHRPYTRDALGRMTSEGGWTLTRRRAGALAIGLIELGAMNLTIICASTVCEAFCPFIATVHRD